MHADQVEITVDVVARLVATQFPQWRDLPVRPVVSHGTVNALFRLGEELVLRLPLQPSAEVKRRDELRREQDIAQRIATGARATPHGLPALPEPVAIGEPGEGYAGWWSTCRWIPGETASEHTIGDHDVFARDLAGFVKAMRELDPEGRHWNGRSRGGPLRTRDDSVRHALAASTHLTDTAGLTEAWQRCLEAEPAAADVWIHADLMPGNLLVRGGRLVGVIDLETACVGDPAVDLMPAWNLLPPAARDTYRGALSIDDHTWERGRGWAIVQAIVALPYYVDTNPVMADTARHTLNAVLE